jgi:LysM repeat protein
VDGLGLVDRRLLARWVAPVVFLLAVTGVVLVVRSGLRNDSSPAATTTKRPVIGARRPAPKPVPVTPRQWYVIQSGDTLGAIASRYATSVEALLRLNPGVEPTTLRPGERLRIK